MNSAPTATIMARPAPPVFGSSVMFLAFQMFSVLPSWDSEARTSAPPTRLSATTVMVLRPAPSLPTVGVMVNWNFGRLIAV